jgi:prolyl-tRNA editing enzyme YbaK/EbsC (Cys-tRNA(Pro) deacylase)
MGTFLGFETREFPEGTHTVADAAAAVGVAPGQIVKSLVVRRDSGEAVLVAVSGTLRLDLAKVASLVGEPVSMAPAKWVREVTGSSIGGVPPAGHAAPIETLIDQDLLAYDEVWAAAGNPYEVFPIAPSELVELTGGRVVEVAEGG